MTHRSDSSRSSSGSGSTTPAPESKPQDKPVKSGESRSRSVKAAPKSSRQRRGGRAGATDDFRWGFVGDDTSDTAVEAEKKTTSTASFDYRDERILLPQRKSDEPEILGEDEISALVVTSTPTAPAKPRRRPAAKPAAPKTAPKTKPTSRASDSGRHIAKPPFPDDDDSLALPSYGRSHIVSPPTAPTPKAASSLNPPRANQGQPQKVTAEKTAEKKVVVEKVVVEKVKVENVAKPPRLRLPKDAVPAAPPRPKMKWDPQRREYVPVADSVVEPKPQHQKTQSPQVQPPKPQHQKTEPSKPEPLKTAPLAKPVATPETVASSLASRRARSTVRVKQDRIAADVVADAEAEPAGFASLGLSPEMLAALKVVRYLEPTPIQRGVLASVIAGRDVMGQARTGTGKTAAFVIPLLEMIARESRDGGNPLALILVPTRELAVQVRDEAARLCYGRDILATACYGGKPLAKQILRLRDGVDIVIGTPGRLLDLMARRALVVSDLRWIVLDEADRMLDIGFRPDIEKILRQVPQDRQTLLFSATLPAPVVRLAERYMREPEVLDFSEKDVAVETIEQFYVTIDPERKFDALVHLLEREKPSQSIVFCRTKRGADKVARLLTRRVASVAVIHGDLAQTVRDSVMTRFRSGEVKVLVATDVVGRGIDVSGISHIINYDIPAFCDDYIHRVGRTGRMGREGVAFTFVTTQEGQELTRIEMRINKLLKRSTLEGFEAFSKPVADSDDEEAQTSTAEAKPVFGKPQRRVRRSL